MNERLVRFRDALRRRAAAAFSRAVLLRAAAGAGAGIACLAVGSVLAGEGFSYLLPSGVVHYGLLGAIGYAVLRECFLVARERPGAWKAVLSGALLGTGLGLLWIVLLTALGALSQEDGRSYLQMTAMVTPFAGALLSLWMRAGGPRTGRIHAVLKGVGSTWLVIILLVAVLYGAGGHTTGGRTYSLRWMWEELVMTYYVALLLIAHSAPFLLPPMAVLAALLRFTNRRLGGTAPLPPDPGRGGPLPAAN